MNKKLCSVRSSELVTESNSYIKTRQGSSYTNVGLFTKCCCVDLVQRAFGSLGARKDHKASKKNCQVGRKFHMEH